MCPGNDEEGEDELTPRRTVIKIREKGRLSFRGWAAEKGDQKEK